MTTLHMDTEIVRALSNHLKQCVEAMHTQTQILNNAAQYIDWIGPSHDEFVSEAQALIHQIESRIEIGIVLAGRVDNEVSEWEAMAAQLAGSIMGGIGMYLDATTQKQFDEFIKTHSWSLLLSGNGKPMLTFGDGRQIDLSAVEAGDANARKSLGEWVERQALLTNVGEAVTEGKWVQVSGYLNGRSGNWVDDYARTLPGGKGLGRSLGTLGTTLELGDIGSSFIAALTDNKEGQWVEIPLGEADGKPIVYSLYVPPQDHWRDVATKTGGFLMGIPGEAIGTAAGAVTSPVTGPVGPVAGNVAGGQIGGNLGEALVGSLYDTLVPKPDMRPNPHSNMVEAGTVSIGNETGIYMNTNPDADVIDLAQMIKPNNEGISSQVTYTFGPDGKPHLNIITSSDF